MPGPTLPSILILLGAVISSGCSPDQNDDAELTEPYFGQKPPGLIPKVFAPGIVSLGPIADAAKVRNWVVWRQSAFV